MNPQVLSGAAACDGLHLTVQNVCLGNFYLIFSQDKKNTNKTNPTNPTNLSNLATAPVGEL